jgi:hypothetical protein
MYRREEELWSNLAERGVALAADGTIVANPASAIEPSQTTPKRAASAARRRMTTRRAKSPSHLGN